MSNTSQKIKINHDREQLVFKCIQQLIEDSADTFTMNNFKASSPYLMELFGNRTLYIHALSEDGANKELYMHLFILDQLDFNEAKLYSHKLPATFIDANKALMEGGETAYSVFDKFSKFKPLFGLDFGIQPVIMHHLWSKKRIVGGVTYSSDDVNADINNFVHILPIINVLTSLFSQRQSHLKLELELETLKQVIDLVPQRVFWKNRDCLYLGGNTAIANDAGFSDPKDLIGKSTQDIFLDVDGRALEGDIRTMKTREHMVNVELQHTTKKEGDKWYRVSKSPLENKLNEVIGTVGTYDDITELKQIQLELQKAKDELEDRVNERTLDLKLSNGKLTKTLKELKKTKTQLIDTEKMAALGNLVAGISHEINTPIGVSVTAASHLQETIKELQTAFSSGELTEEHFLNFCSTADDCSNILLKNLARASDLIKSFKQIAIDQSHDKPRMVKLNEYVSSILATLTPVFKNKNIEIEVDIDKSINLIIYPGVFAQIVTNFTENAMKHAFPNDDMSGKYRIHCYLTDDNIHLHFIDNGVGIPLELQKKIFEPFYTTKAKSGGSGLGLSIVYNIIYQKFNGKIECNSDIGKGTDFYINIPKQTNLDMKYA